MVGPAHTTGEAPLSAPLVPTGTDAPRRSYFDAPVPAGYPAMIDELRSLLDRVAATTPPADVVTAARRRIAEVDARLADHEAAEADWLSGRLETVPGRGQLIVPAYDVDEVDDEHARGRIAFGRQYLGSNGSVHGGVIPLLFDDLIGRFVLARSGSRSRTAYLHVDYRSVTPVGPELQLEVHLERVEGRKRFLRGTVSDGARLCAEASALFVAVRPGQV